MALGGIRNATALAFGAGRIDRTNLANPHRGIFCPEADEPWWLPFYLLFHIPHGSIISCGTNARAKLHVNTKFTQHTSGRLLCQTSTLSSDDEPAGKVRRSAAWVARETPEDKRVHGFLPKTALT
jgi:hypothetical protein